MPDTATARPGLNFATLEMMEKMDMVNMIKSYFAKEKDVLCAYLFGSTATGKENKFSDVDIALLFDNDVSAAQYTQKCLSIMDNLSHILNKDVDVVILNSASSFLKFQIIKNGLKIYERPDRIGRDFEAKAIIEYFDFLPVRRKLEMALINSIKET